MFSLLCKWWLFTFTLKDLDTFLGCHIFKDIFLFCVTGVYNWDYWVIQSEYTLNMILFHCILFKKKLVSFAFCYTYDKLKHFQWTYERILFATLSYIDLRTTGSIRWKRWTTTGIHEYLISAYICPAQNKKNVTEFASFGFFLIL